MTPELCCLEAQLLAGGRVVTPDGVHENAWVQIAEGQIVSVTATRPDSDLPVIDLEGAWLLPGYIDMHMHGGGGHSVADSQESMMAAVAFHAHHGTTTTLVSLMTAPLDALVEQLGWAATLTHAKPTSHGCVLGAHLEGPFLSPARRGAQNESHMIAPDLLVLEQLLNAAAGALRMITLAPELEGALQLFPSLLDANVIIALGHSDATYEEAMAAIIAGATQATHLFNGMKPLHHRDPGLAGAALDSGLACELINDGIHVHPAVMKLVWSTCPCPILITDAIDATGIGDGHYRLGGKDVEVLGGSTRLAETGALAGSTLTLDIALKRAVQVNGLTIEQASSAVSANPARALGIADTHGSISASHVADLVVLDDDLDVQHVFLRGVHAALQL